MDTTSARIAAAVAAHAVRLAAVEQRVRTVRASVAAGRTRSGPGPGLAPHAADPAGPRTPADGPALRTVRGKKCVCGGWRVKKGLRCA